MKKVTFTNEQKLFTLELRKKVNEYFKTNGIAQTGNRSLYWKTVILFTLVGGLYFCLMFFSLSWMIAIPLCILLGLGIAGIGFNVMHDGAHGSYSSRKWVNELMGFSLNILGGNVFLWKVKHNNNHHSYTNIEGIDEDIDIRPYIRTSAEQSLRWHHRYQHYYWVFLYAMVYFAWIFMKDFRKYFTRKIADTTFRKMTLTQHLTFWFSKLLYIAIFIAIPVWHVGWLDTLIGYSVMSAACGFTLGVIFQLAHVIEGTKVDSVVHKENIIVQDWTIHQLNTTSNFSTRSRVMTWFAGGLNFQVEHHLFPNISHIHYPAINKLVKEVCARFDVRYMEYPTFFKALRSHVIYLRSQGRDQFMNARVSV